MRDTMPEKGQYAVVDAGEDGDPTVYIFATEDEAYQHIEDSNWKCVLIAWHADGFLEYEYHT